MNILLVVLVLIILLLISISNSQHVKYIPERIIPIEKIEPTQTKKVIAYDYDNTLVDINNFVISPMVEKMKKDYVDGHKVYIVTYRYQRHIDPIHEFLDKMGMSDVEVIATNRTDKSIALRKINADIFYDDQPGIVQEVKMNYPTAEVYLVDYKLANSVKDYRGMVQRV